MPPSIHGSIVESSLRRHQPTTYQRSVKHKPVDARHGENTEAHSIQLKRAARAPARRARAGTLRPTLPRATPLGAGAPSSSWRRRAAASSTPSTNGCVMCTSGITTPTATTAMATSRGELRQPRGQQVALRRLRGGHRQKTRPAHDGSQCLLGCRQLEHVLRDSVPAGS